MMTHKKFTPPEDPMYQPLHVGRATSKDLGYPGDNTGDHISELNCYYSELSGLYWIWKNEKDADILGLCHYRRFLLNSKEQLLNKAEIIDLLKDYDILTSKSLDLNFSYGFGFTQNHTKEDLDAACLAIKELYPDFYPLFCKRLGENHTYFGNIMICKRAIFNEYCQFLFPIFEHMHSHLDLDAYDDYHKRLYGFISEFILMVWCEYRKLVVKECKVGLVGEKKETTEVISTLCSYLAKIGQASPTEATSYIRLAKKYFLSVHKQRPDILMEASDIHGHLHLCLQALSTAEFELDHDGTITLPLTLPSKDLFHLLEHLNAAILCIQAKQETSAHLALLESPAISSSAVWIAIQLFCKTPQDKNDVICRICSSCTSFQLLDFGP